MYHEMFHCFEYSMIKDPKVIAILSNPKKFSKKEREWAKERTHPISDGEESNRFNIARTASLREYECRIFLLIHFPISDEPILICNIFF